MSHYDNAGVWIFGIIGSFCSFLSGHVGQSVTILLGMMILDIITGLLKGAKAKRLKSAIMHMGIIKKAGLLIAIVLATLLDMLINDSQPIFRTLMVWVAIANEGLSIIENLTAIGVYVPKQMKDRLAQVAKEGSDLQKEKDGLK